MVLSVPILPLARSLEHSTILYEDPQLTAATVETQLEQTGPQLPSNICHGEI